MYTCTHGGFKSSAQASVARAVRQSVELCCVHHHLTHCDSHPLCRKSTFSAACGAAGAGSVHAAADTCADAPNTHLAPPATPFAAGCTNLPVRHSLPQLISASAELSNYVFHLLKADWHVSSASSRPSCSGVPRCTWGTTASAQLFFP